MSATAYDSPPHERLRSARRYAGLRQRDVAAGTGLTRETIAKVEAGDPRYVTTRTLILIAGFLGAHVSMAELLEVAK